MVTRSSIPRFFFSKKEKQHILEVIAAAERKTSGEIRVHVQKTTQDNFSEEAKRTFEKLGMTKTTQRNGVLIFFCIAQRRFAILGDQGIDQKVPPYFWEDIVQLMEVAFKEDRFADGLVAGIDKIGEKLQTFFPVEATDVNELPNWLSF